ncbi:efflux RND transporter periplasmic adaptor subunit [Glaciecola siphonariae]|uniref:Efflux RND transporter periplasmic adaptor subunit n=1 Tax=Glaciecola siphonariae TaxID=521012 RepID=A0ABV9M191_9ALTE
MRKSYVIAALCSLLFVLWMLSGMLFDASDSDGNSDSSSESGQSAQNTLFKVAVKTMQAKPTQLYVTSNGQVEPNSVVQVRAQTQGQIEKRFATEGDRVEKGQVIAAIELNDRKIRLEQEQALLASRSNTLKRLQQLAQSNYQSQSDLDRAQADVKASEANIAAIELEIEHTQIKAPISGVIEQFSAEQGDFVQVNSPVAVLLEQSPLIVRLPIAQQDVNKLSIGSEADISLSTGEELTGTLRYISPRANEQTRTFEVEIEINNADGKLRSGMSARAKIATEQAMAHFISPSLFSLGTGGEIGVKVVDSDNVVHFREVSILQSNTQGAWVSGLDAQIRIIVNGQGFVKDGNQVAVEELSPQEAR